MAQGVRYARAGTFAALAAAGVVLAACGGGKQDANEPSGTWKLDVVSATFPGRQHLATRAVLRIQVKNLDSRPIPNLAITVDGFGRREEDSSLADPRRPIWIVDTPPTDATTAFTNTWAVGSVPPGRTRTLDWLVTAVRAGTYTLRYSASAGLDGKAKAVLPDGTTPKGSFIVRVSPKPRPPRIPD